MKHIFLFIFLILSFFILKAQTFAPVGTFWNYAYEETYMDCPMVTCAYGQETIEAIKDTSVNGIQASKLKFTIAGSAYPGTGNISNTYFGFLLQKADSVFYASDGSLKDLTYLYGFNMNVHDTIHYPDSDLAIDSIKNENLGGTVRKVFYTTQFCPSGSMGGLTKQVVRIVEGIGPVNGYLIPYMSNLCAEYGKNYSFSCFKNSSTEYPQGSNCKVITEVKKDKEIIFSIYPNPSNGNIHISCQLSNLQNIEIYNTTGVRTATISNLQAYGNIIDLDLNYFPKGSYLLRITDIDGAFSTEKMIIE